jgi:hypothetical protein
VCFLGGRGEGEINGFHERIDKKKPGLEPEPNLDSILELKSDPKTKTRIF